MFMYKWCTAVGGHARNPLLVPSAIHDSKLDFHRDRKTKNLFLTIGQILNLQTTYQIIIPDLKYYIPDSVHSLEYCFSKIRANTTPFIFTCHTSRSHFFKVSISDPLYNF